MKSGFFIALLIFHFLTSTLFSQNLVPNPSFENHKTRPIKTLLDYELDSLLNDWTSPTKASPDFYVSLDDTSTIDNYTNINLFRQRAFDGNVFVGLLLQIYFGEFISLEHINYREYIQAKLDKPMKKGLKYYVSMYYKLSERSTYAIDGLGIYFSNDNISNNSYLLSYKPQISNMDGKILTNRQWSKLEGYFIPENKMNYITIGNFKRYPKIHFSQIQPTDSISSPYSYYLVDKIEVYEVSMNDSGIDTNNNYKPTPQFEPNKVYNNQLDTTISKNNVIKNDTLVLPDILFEFGKARLLKEHYSELETIVYSLVTSPDTTITIEGFTDSIGNDEKNQQLSIDRANAVATFLIGNGIDKSRIKTYGYGETRPVDDNGSEIGRSKNRRVEIIFRKNN